MVDYKNKLETVSGSLLILILLVGCDGAATTWTVNPGESIQSAINNAAAGDTILVQSGTYYENVIVYEAPLTLQGVDTGGGLPVVDAGGSGSAITLVTDGCTLRDFVARNSSSSGIQVASSYNTVTGNTATGFAIGIDIDSPSLGGGGNTISANTATGNGDGIYLGSSRGNSITGNTASGNNQGIRLASSSNSNTISSNTATGNTNYGIYLSSSSGNNITGNTATGNSYAGIGLYSSSNGNNITGNTATGNTNYGILLDTSSGNIIYLNTFDNTHNAFSNGANTNHWNATTTQTGLNLTGLLGNIWSDYNGIDCDGDGIGDTPYDITGGLDRDYHPLGGSGAVPALEAEKLADREEALVGDTINYTVRVNNTGNVILTDVWAWDNLTSAVWDVGTLEPGENYTNTTSYRVNLTDLPGPVTNELWANGTDPCGFEVNNSAIETVEVRRGPAIEIEKTTSPSCGLPGSDLTFTINVTNVGDVNFTGVAVADLLPAGLVHISSTPDGTVAGKNVTWNLGSLGPESSISIEMTVQIESGTPSGSLTNLVNATGTPLIGGNVSNGTTCSVGVGIQAAINAASPGDTIEVHSGIYREHVNVNKSLTLRGVDNGTGLPVVDASGTGDAITLSADGCTIEGFVAKNDGSHYSGIKATSDGNTISGNTATDNLCGIYLSSSSDNNISGNIISNNYFKGIHLFDSSGNNIESNIVSNNNGGGITLNASSDNNIVTANTATGNYNGIGVVSSNNNTIYLNAFNNINNGWSDSTNTWNSPTEIEYRGNTTRVGNLWSDYTGRDIDGDGIGNVPYEIPGGSEHDYYPLTNNSGSSTLTVCASGCDYTRIQDAINAASAGDTIEVHGGTYFEHVNVSKTLTLRGVDNGSGMPVVDAGGNGSAIILSADGCVIEGFVARNSGVSYPNAGIEVYSNGNTISSNTASGNYYGMFLDSSTGNTVSGNDVTDNSQHGIRLNSSCNNTISSNTATGNNYYGIWLFSSSDNNTIWGNNVTGSINGIRLQSSNGNTILGNTATGNNNYGIGLIGATGNTISGNTATGNQVGTYLTFSSDNTISSNTANDNLYGIAFEFSCSTNTISGNTATGNTEAGISLYSSGGNIIYLNTFENSNNAYSDSANSWNATTTVTWEHEGRNLTGLLGNVWSDYDGLDCDGDGIGDTPYNIEGPTGEKDYHPISDRQSGPGIEVEKVADRAEAEVGEIINYTIFVNNTGDLNLTDVRAEDNLTGDVWYVGPLLPGENYTNTTSYRVNLTNLPGPLTNELWANGTDPTGTEVNDSAVETVEVRRGPAIEIEKTASPSGGLPGSDLTFTINVTNVGDVNFSEVVIADLMPAGLVHISSTPTGTVDGKNVTWDLGTLAPGNSVSIEMVAEIENATASGNLTNLVNATGTPLIGGNVSNGTTCSVGVGIQAAIDAASPGNAIEVPSGTYRENVNVNKQLTLRGIGSPVVDAGGNGSSITLSADGCTLEGFVVTNSGSYWSNAGVTVTSKSNTISGNTATGNNREGISLFSSSDNTISGNTATGNNGEGISLFSSSDNTISGNTATGNYWCGIHLYGSSDNNTISGNIATGNIDDGIYIASSSDNTISGNNATGNRDAGIYLYTFSDNNTISGNTATGNDWDGICLDGSSDNTISGNTATGNRDGIFLVDSTSNTISGNTVSGNTDHGIYIASSNGNTVYLNTFDNANNSWSNSANNWNATTTQTYEHSGRILTGLLGNFWSDYDGIDCDGDGVGDTSYDEIAGGSEMDYHPIGGAEACPGIEVEKVADRSEVEVGDMINYSIWVNNTGNVTLTGVQAEDNLTSTVWEVGTLEPGQNYTNTTSYLVNETDLPGPVTNELRANGIDPCGFEVNDSCVETVSISCVPGIVVNKTSDVSTAEVGDTVEYTVWVNNTGNVNLTSVAANDNLTGDVWNIGTLTPGQNYTNKTTYVVRESDLCKLLVNNLSAEGEAIGTGIIGNFSIVSVETTSTPRIEVNKTANVSCAKIGDNVEYTIRVNNTGNVNLTDVSAFDNLTGWKNDSIGTLAPGEGRTFKTTYKINESDLGKYLVNNATANGTDPCGGRVANFSLVSIETIFTPGIVVNKTATPAGGLPADNLTFTINVTNTGNCDLADVEVKDLLPDGLRHISSTPAGTVDGKNVTWVLGTLAPGNSTLIEMVAEIESGITSGNLTNLVNATGTPPVGDNVSDGATCNVWVGIQAAIDAASPGDIIEVHSGTYRENVVVNKQLTLRGVDNGTGLPVVDAEGTGDAITLSADGCTLEGFIATNSGNYENDAGIKITSDNNIIENNNASFNGWNGFILQSSSGNTLKNNQMYRNGFSNFRADNVYEGNDIDTSNLVDGKPIYYLVDKSGIAIDSPTNAGVVYCFNCNDITVKNQKDVSDNYYGIYFYNTINSKIDGCNLNYDDESIVLVFSSGNDIRNNVVGETGRNFGIVLYSSDGNSLANNTVNGNSYGIRLETSNNNILKNNSANNNDCAGISLLWTSCGNKVEGNTANDNNEHGIRVETTSNNNEIYLNKLNGNAKNAYSDSTNLWRSPEMKTYRYNGSTYSNYTGNFWSDYAGTDANDDGIGDSPYPIDGGSELDDCPMMPGASIEEAELRLTINGSKFYDINANGSWDSGEPGLEGWEVRLWDADNGSLINSTLTNSNGSYRFEVPTGNYTVSEALMPGWVQTYPPSGNYTIVLTDFNATGIDFGNLHLTAGASIEVNKTSNRSGALPGNEVFFAINVSNPGNSRLHPVIVRDRLPSGLDYISSNPEGTVNGNEVLWMLGPLAPGNSTLVDLVVRINSSATGNLTNFANVTGIPSEGENVTDEDWCEIKVFESIQAAIDAASPGDTIVVHSGIYYENVDVNKQLTLRGIGSPIVDASGSGSVITLSADGCTLEGFVATNSGDLDAGIDVTSNDNIIEGNALNGNSYGVRLDLSSNNTISSNSAINNTYNGFRLWSASGNIILENEATGSIYDGILVLSAGNNTVSGNTASWNDRSGIGIWSSSDNVITDNTASNNNEGICLRESSGNVVKDNVASDNAFGIGIYNISTKNTIESNAVYDNTETGIDISSASNDNEIFLNDLKNNPKNAYSESSNTWRSPEKRSYQYKGSTYTNYTGNFWSDYAGVDDNGDGIGDSPYSISGGSEKDEYPMISDASGSPKIAVKKSVSPEFATPGTDVAYQINITNAGDIYFEQVLVRDLVPSGLYQIEANLSGTVTGNQVDWTIGPLNVSESVHLLVTARVDGTKFGCLVNTVNATGVTHAGGNTTDYDTVNLTALRSGIDLNKTANVTVAGIGDVINYNISIVNTGDSNLTNVQAHDNLTNETWDLSILVPGRITNLSTNYTVTEEDVCRGFVRNSAVASGLDCCDNYVNADDYENVTVAVSNSSLNITKIANTTGPVTASELIEYRGFRKT
jgi:uncharacterized repeat protein (TIGR01451 family)